MNDNDKYSYIKFLWEIFRRHPDYIGFCTEHQFDKEGWLIINDTKCEKAEKIKKRFGVEMILNHEFEATNYELNLLFRDAHRSVSRVSFGIEDIPETHIRVDIDTRAPISAIVEDLKHWFRLRDIAREVSRDVLQTKEEKDDSYFPKKLNPGTDRVAFEVWDLYKKGMKNMEIAETLWPNEYYEAEANNEEAQDKEYFRLIEKYQKEGIEDYETRAFKEAYKNDSPALNTLIKRVEDKITRVQKLFEMF